MSIGVHIFGPGFGESVVIELPDGTVGVIDSFCDSQGRSPVLEFITQTLGSKSLAFLALSHPHADHCNGLRELLGRLEVKEFWIFDAFQDFNLRHFFLQLYKRGDRDAVEEALKFKPGTVVQQLAYLDRQYLVPLKRKFQNRVRLLRSSDKFSMGEGSLAVHFITPGDHSLISYREKLRADLSDLVSDGPVLNKAWGVSRINHNLVSGSILLEYGNARILLMGDAEQPLWNEALERYNLEGLWPIQLIKVAHHGSQNGFVPELFRKVASAETSLSIMTPFDRLENSLPRREGIEQIACHSAEVFCTNRTSAAESSGLRWEPAGTAPVAAPTELVALLSKQPDLREFLSPEFGGPDDVPVGKSVPLDLSALIAKTPKAIQALHPSLRNIHLDRVRDFMEDEFRVSFYFDKSGREDISRRYLGWGAGRLRLH